MIYTMTFNPALDYIIQVDGYQPGQVNRAQSEKILPGGKGINVSIVLHNLGIENTALGFSAGFTGGEIQRLLAGMGCRTEFISLDAGMSRINVKLKTGEETEINGQGPKISPAALEALYQKLAGLQDGDYLVLAGSVPADLPDAIYCEIMQRLADKKLHFVVDAVNELLLNVLPYHPFLIKPNHHELGELFGRVLQTEDEIVGCAKQLQTQGARNVLVSLGGDGGILVTESGEVLKSPAPKGKLVNSTGAGDSMVAGFLAGYLESGSYRHAFLMGLAAGSASAFSENLATRDEVLKVYQEIEK